MADVNATADAPQLVTAKAIDLLIKESASKADSDRRTPAQSVTKRVSWHPPTHQTTAYICESTLPMSGARKATGDVAREKEVATGLPVAPLPSVSSHGNDDSIRQPRPTSSLPTAARPHDGHRLKRAHLTNKSATEQAPPASRQAERLQPKRHETHLTLMAAHEPVLGLSSSARCEAAIAKLQSSVTDLAA